MILIELSINAYKLQCQYATVILLLIQQYQLA